MGAKAKTVRKETTKSREWQSRGDNHFLATTHVRALVKFTCFWECLEYSILIQNLTQLDKLVWIILGCVLTRETIRSLKNDKTKKSHLEVEGGWDVQEI